jgi:O-methyltransferase
MYLIGRDREKWIYNYDYFRCSTLELVAQELNEYYQGDGGNVAELGVYRGDFAQWINYLFPKQKLYLFDTFEGFSKRNFNNESNSSWIDQDFSNTSVQLVLEKMKYPENCIIRKGFFPETILGLENEEYIFVSIDADLYEPIYEGLKYFYPRLKKHGYIFVHDYNITAYCGVKKAVKQFSKENDISFFPLSDQMGTVVFVK